MVPVGASDYHIHARGRKGGINVRLQAFNSWGLHPDDIEDMRVELSSGDVPNETAVEREARAQEIISRNMGKCAPAASAERKPSGATR